VFKYNDKVKKFVRRSIQRVPYFRGIATEALHDIMYLMKDRIF
jgi:hypothetical protein